MVHIIVHPHGYPLLCGLDVLTQVDGDTLMFPLVARRLIQRQVIPEVKGRARLEVGARVDMVAPRAIRNLAV